VRFAAVRDLRGPLPVGVACRLLGVGRAGYYAWLGRPPPAGAARRAALLVRVRAAHAAGRGAYGSPRVHAALLADGSGGPAACVNTVARVMRAAGVRSEARRRSRPRTTDSAHAHPVAPNLLGRDFAAAAPDEKWVADITYVPTGEGWLYLAVVLDLHSRRVVGWSMAEHLRADLCLDALGAALADRDPPPGLLHHSDRGVQYAGGAHRRLLAGRGAACSMSRRADCWDNAAMESFWATLKTELVHRVDYATRAQARASVFEYIEAFYNRTRLHSTLGYVSPEQFEAGRR
jgi:transposase InsO family protein